MNMQPRKDETPGDGNRRGFKAGRPLESVHVNSADVIALRQAKSYHLDDLPHPMADVLPPTLNKAQRLEVVRRIASRYDPRGVIAGCEPLPRMLEVVLWPYVRSGPQGSRVGRLELHALLADSLTTREAA